MEQEDGLKIGIVGSGFAANFHFESYKRLNVNVKGIYSRSESNRLKFAEERNIKAYENFEDMLEDVDAVDICSPGSTHEYYSVKAAEAGKHVIVEKPFTGYYGPPDMTDDWKGNAFSKAIMLENAVESARRITDAAEKNGITLCYAENWVYAPSVQKEVEILKSSKGQILWIIGEESHSGSHSPFYGSWRHSGGGSLTGKSCHPLTAALYLKRVEGEINNGVPIRPVSVSARTHEITRNVNYKDAGYLRTDYWDVEDFSQVHIVFSDGMVADIFSNELVMGGVHNWLEVFANNHRMRCNINPTDACSLYAPDEELVKDVYIVEKIGTKQGWSFPSPDEDWNTGYPQEIENFVRCIKEGKDPESGKELAQDTVATIYSAYLSAEKKGMEQLIPQ